MGRRKRFGLGLKTVGQHLPDFVAERGFFFVMHGQFPENMVQPDSACVVLQGTGWSGQTAHREKRLACGHPALPDAEAR
jgi:hypothetical protein